MGHCRASAGQLNSARPAPRSYHPQWSFLQLIARAQMRNPRPTWHACLRCGCWECDSRYQLLLSYEQTHFNRHTRQSQRLMRDRSNQKRNWQTQTTTCPSTKGTNDIDQTMISPPNALFLSSKTAHIFGVEILSTQITQADTGTFRTYTWSARARSGCRPLSCWSTEVWSHHRLAARDLQQLWVLLLISNCLIDILFLVQRAQNDKNSTR